MLFTDKFSISFLPCTEKYFYTIILIIRLICVCMRKDSLLLLMNCFLGGFWLSSFLHILRGNLSVDECQILLE